jgi:hypothetical protein
MKGIAMQSDLIDEPELLASLIKDGALDLVGEPIVCRVEVDLKGWVKELAGGGEWEVLDEQEDDLATTFTMHNGHSNAEVTLYQTGHAMVDIDGAALFNGNLAEQGGRWTQLTYFNALNGERITLN